MRRARVAMACALGLLALAAMWSAFADRVTPPELGHPALAPGDEVVLAIGRVIAVDDGGAVLEDLPETYVVRGQAEWAVGEEWSVGGTWDGEAIALAWAEPHPGRPGKKLLGLLGLSLVAGLGSWGLRFSARGLVARG